jgi:hypothetical protein
MSLVNLKTNLTSLKYGNDQPGGGSSGQPFITTDVNDPYVTRVNISNNNLLDLIGINKFNIPTVPNVGALLGQTSVGGTINSFLNSDEFIRGGAAGSAQASINDTLRIGSFFLSLPKGPLFIAKQIGLQFSNPRLESRKGISGLISSTISTDPISGVVSSLTGGTFGPTRIYNLGINTIAQIPVTAYGGHFSRHGLLPIQTEDTKYESIARFNNTDAFQRVPYIPNISGPSNRLVRYAKKFSLGVEPSNNNIFSEGISRTLNFVSKYIGLNIPNLLDSDFVVDSYLGGPGSLYGIGGTTINRVTFTANKNHIEDAFERAEANSKLKSIDFSQAIGKRNVRQDKKSSIDNYDVNFFRGQIRDLNNYIANAQAVKFVDSIATSKYKQLKLAIDKRAKQGPNIFNPNPVQREYNGYPSYNTSKSNKIEYDNGHSKVIVKGTWSEMNREIRIGHGRIDQINLTPIFSTTEFPGNYITVDSKTYYTRDLVKFRIGAIDSDDPSKTEWMIFRAYLTGFQDSLTAEWGDTKYVGRGEKFKIYNGFDRSITFSFKVAALSKNEMQPMYQKLNFLASNMMPDYNKNLKMRGPFVKVTVGDYINSQPGVITSLTYSVADDTPWEITLDSPEGGEKLYDLPHIIDVSMTFIPIGVMDGGTPKKGINTPVMVQAHTTDGNPWIDKAKISSGTQAQGRPTEYDNTFLNTADQNTIKLLEQREKERQAPLLDSQRTIDSIALPTAIGDAQPNVLSPIIPT